jgi:ubiquinone/menaquinone biosynthesis C-methylase UbiE
MNIRRISYNIYSSARKIIAPNLAHSQALYEKVLESHLAATTRWLDLGCGHHVLPSWRLGAEKDLVESCDTVVGLDFDLGSLNAHQTIDQRVRGNIAELPFIDNHFDLVTANMVVEHLDKPEVQFQEIYRILKPGGLFLFHTPNALGYLTIGARLVPEAFKDRLVYLLDGRSENDVFEAHYKANTRNRIGELAQASGFELVKIKMLVSEAGFMFIPPLAIPELFWIKVLMTKSFKPLRTTIIAVLKKGYV